MMYFIPTINAEVTIPKTITELEDIDEAIEAANDFIYDEVKKYLPFFSIDDMYDYWFERDDYDPKYDLPRVQINMFDCTCKTDKETFEEFETLIYTKFDEIKKTLPSHISIDVLDFYEDEIEKCEDKDISVDITL